MKKIVLSMLVILMLIINGCALTPQVIELKPNVDIIKSNEGNNSCIVIKVIDERPITLIGYKGSADISRGGAISTTQNLERLVHDEIVKGLLRKGFKILTHNKNKCSNLKIEIRLLEYYTSTGFWTGGVHTKAAFKVKAEFNTKTYEKLYRVGNEERVVVVPTDEKNTQIVNKILNDILKKVLNDHELIKFLSKL